MTQFKDLTKEQQEHFTRLIKYYEIPAGTTHIDPDDKHETSFMMKVEREGWYTYTQGEFIEYDYPDESEYYPLPSPPYYVPEDVAFNSSEKSRSNVYVIDVEAINEVAELIQQNNPYRTGETLHSIRKGIWDLIKQSVDQHFEMVSTGGATVFKSCGEDGVMDISVMYNPCRDHKYVTMSQEEMEDI